MILINVADPLKAIRKSLKDMSQNFARKVILGLNLPITYSKAEGDELLGPFRPGIDTFKINQPENPFQSYDVAKNL